jgi:hypothetical protein
MRGYMIAPIPLRNRQDVWEIDHNSMRLEATAVAQARRTERRYS